MRPRSRARAQSQAGSASASQSAGRGRHVPAVLRGVPTEYQDLLQEALQAQNATSSPDRPRKKRRVGLRQHAAVQVEEANNAEPSGPDAKKQPQTVYLSDDSDSDIAFEDVHMGEESEVEDDDFQEEDEEEDTGPLDLTLIAKPVKLKAPVRQRKGTTNADRALKLQIHKMHLLCLIAFNDRRSNWCNDKKIHKSLRPLVSEKTLSLLRPKASLAQFGRSEALKKGLHQICISWGNEFKINSRGIRRPQWMDERVIGKFKIPDMELLHERADFIQAAKDLEGSRDTGVQLFCALLRSIGLDVRLVCSLQPLPFTGKGTQIQSDLPQQMRSAEADTPESTSDSETVDIYSKASGFGESSDGPMTARRRLGHPGAADYNLPTITIPKTPPKPKKRFRESPYPVYWVEVLDTAYQKWIPVDPLVTNSVGKPRMFEPPASDSENLMTYVIAFDDEGTARDVTRRYAKAYNAKTRKLRVESTTGGEKWWSKTMGRYQRGWKTDAEQIEDTELAAAEAREPMPKNVIDFKDHPVYALGRHLKKNEVLVNRRQVGRISAGKKVEMVYRRSDVKTARSADRWYRMGREVKEGEQPVKINASKDEEEAGVGLYTEDQTILYECPPVVNGRIPKNSYGNLDVYVPTMVPRGGIHIPHPEAARAARLLAVDYADAVTGFEFRGRRGTAVLNGIVCAIEYQEAVDAVIQGFHDQSVREEDERRSALALRTWKRFLVALRIKERVDAYEVEGEDKGATQLDKEHVAINEEADVSSPDHGYGYVAADDAELDYNAEEGGGFLMD